MKHHDGTMQPKGQSVGVQRLHTANQLRTHSSMHILMAKADLCVGRYSSETGFTMRILIISRLRKILPTRKAVDLQA
jgi:hypothetical protein